MGSVVHVLQLYLDESETVDLSLYIKASGQLTSLWRNKTYSMCMHISQHSIIFAYAQTHRIK